MSGQLIEGCQQICQKSQVDLRGISGTDFSKCTFNTDAVKISCALQTYADNCVEEFLAAPSINSELLTNVGQNPLVDASGLGKSLATTLGMDTNIIRAMIHQINFPPVVLDKMLPAFAYRMYFFRLPADPDNNQLLQFFQVLGRRLGQVERVAKPDEKRHLENVTTIAKLAATVHRSEWNEVVDTLRFHPKMPLDDSYRAKIYPLYSHVFDSQISPTMYQIARDVVPRYY